MNELLYEFNKCFAYIRIQTVHRTSQKQYQILNQMYVTRPLSLYRQFPESLTSLPPDGPNTGILVIQDEGTENTSCFGLCKGDLKDLPFPQNKNLTIQYVQSTGQGVIVYTDHVILIPVLDQPLSSNRYYVIKQRGKQKGEAYISSTEEDMRNCCFFRCVKNLKPKPLDAKDIYQQFEFIHREGLCGGFHAKSVAPEGYPPCFLRRKGWTISGKTPKNYELSEALGLDVTLRNRLPEFNFPVSPKASGNVVVGKWYCPFVFISEGSIKEQFERSVYYEMTLEQQWEEIFTCDYSNTQSNAVFVDVIVQKEMVRLAGVEAICDYTNVADGMVWFKSSTSKGEHSVGLNSAIVERMKLEQERFGWSSKGGNQEAVNRVEAFGGAGGWSKFACYVLMERFVLKRMDGSLVLTYDFKHTTHIKSKWE